MSGDFRPGTESQVHGDVAGHVVQARDIHGGIHVHQRPVTLPTPNQLPAAGRLIDRTEALARLTAARGDGRGVLVVSGPAGIGKSAVALHWAHQVRHEYPDGQLYADLRAHSPDEPALPAEVLEQFIRALGITPEHIPARLDERAALYRSLVTDRRVLVLLDDARSAAQVRPLIPSSASSVAIVTSRFRLGSLLVGGAFGLALERLDPKAALDLLRQSLGPERVEGEPGAARRLIALCDRLPLALCVAGARLLTRPHWPLREMVEALEHEQQRLSALSEAELTVRAPLTLSYRGLPAEAARLYRLLGLYPGTTVDSWTAAPLAGIPRGEVKRWLGVLADANLLEDVPTGRYRFHDLTRLHAAETALAEEPEAERDAALDRVVRWTRHAMVVANAHAAPYRRIPGADPAAEELRFDGAAAALDWMEQEFRNLRALTQWAYGHGRAEDAWRLVDAAWPLFLHRGRQTERLDFDRIGLAAARSCGDREGEAKMLNRTGLALREVGRLDEAVEDFRRSLALWEEMGDTRRIAKIRRRLGHVEEDRGRPEAALTLFVAALSAYRIVHEPREEALTLYDIGHAQLAAGRPAQAAGPLRRATELLDPGTDPYNHARALIQLGRATADQDLAAHGLAAMRSLGSRTGVASGLHALAGLAEQAGQDERARRYREEYQRVRGDLGAGDGDLGAGDSEAGGDG